MCLLYHKADQFHLFFCLFSGYAQFFWVYMFFIVQFRFLLVGFFGGWGGGERGASIFYEQGICMYSRHTPAKENMLYISHQVDHNSVWVLLDREK